MLRYKHNKSPETQAILATEKLTQEDKDALTLPLNGGDVFPTLNMMLLHCLDQYTSNFYPIYTFLQVNP